MAYIIMAYIVMARYVAQCRPGMPIVAFTYKPKVARQLMIYRGLHPIVGKPVPVAYIVMAYIVMAFVVMAYVAHDLSRPAPCRRQARPGVCARAQACTAY